MDNNLLIKNALINYDKSRDLINKLITQYFSIFQPESDIDKPIIIFYKNKKKTIIHSKLEYEIMAVHYDDIKLWLWGWARSEDSKNESFTVRRVLKYGLELDGLKNSNNLFLRSIFLNSRLKVITHLEKDILIALSLYISKQLGIIEIKYLNPNYSNILYIKKIIKQ